MEKLIAAMRAHPTAVRFADLVRLCRQLFGEPRPIGGSHQVYRTPGPPVRQVLAAIARPEDQE